MKLNLPSAVTDAGGDAVAEAKGEETRSKEGMIGSTLRENHNMFTQFPKDPNCEVCNRTEDAIKLQQEGKYACLWRSTFHQIRRLDHGRSHNADRGKRAEKCTKEHPYRAGRLNDLDSELSDKNKRHIGNNVVVAKIPSSFTQAGKSVHRQNQKEFVKACQEFFVEA